MKLTSGSLAILGLSVLLAIIVNAVNPQGIDLIAKPLKPAPHIQMPEVLDAFAAGEARFVDARPVQEYVDGHIQGAVNVPMLDKEKLLPRLDRKIPKDAVVIVYCDGEGCEASDKLSARMLQLGWKNVRVFEEGFPAWRDAMLPVSTGENP